MKKLAVVLMAAVMVLGLAGQSRAEGFANGVKSFIGEVGDFDWKGNIGGDFIFADGETYAGAGLTVYSSPWIGVRAGLIGKDSEDPFAYAGLTFNAGKAILIGLEKLNKEGTVNPSIASFLNKNILMPGIVEIYKVEKGEWETGMIITIVQWSIDF